MNTKIRGISEGIFIALSTVLGYWLAFLYQLGYCKYFELPPFFISISISEILFSLIGIMGTLVILNFFLDTIFKFVKHIPKYILNSFIKIIFYIFVFCGYALIHKFHWNKFILILTGILIFTLFFEFLFPIFTQRKVIGYKNKLKEQEIIDSKDNSPFESIISKMEYRFIFIIVFIFLMSYVAYFSGGIDAKLKTEFITYKNKSNFVILKNFDSNFLAAKFDPKTKTVLPEYFLLTPNSIPSPFNFEKIGPLTPIK